MRSAKEANSFPYKAQTICYIEVEGSIVRNVSDKTLRVEAIKRFGRGQSRMYAVWPGNWRSDLFELDYDELVKAFDIQV